MSQKSVAAASVPSAALLSTTYFGPVQWYQKLWRHERVQIEACENFVKQTFRNRCVIATANGPQALTVPVVATGSTPITEVRISDHGHWRHLHWQALQSAYGESPFFEYYEDDLRPFFEPQWEYLFEFNEAIRTTLCRLLDMTPAATLTTDFLPPASAADLSAPAGHLAAPLPGMADYRYSIRPKHAPTDAHFQPRPYWQVYSARHGFLPNLSVLDLLCCMGPEAPFYL